MHRQELYTKIEKYLSNFGRRISMAHSHPSIVKRPGDPKINAGYHPLKNGDVRHLFRFPARGSRMRFSGISPARHSKSNPHQIRIAQWVIVNKIVQLRPLRHSHIQRILDPGTVDRDHSPLPEQQLYAAGVHVERTNFCIVLHNLAFFTPYGTLTVVCRAFL